MPRHCLPPELPRKLIASSVIRGAQLNESHGGLCLIDLTSGAVDCVVDWNTTQIDVEGRGGDRGLRGIAIARDRVFVASTQALLQFDRRFALEHSYANRYLKHCHEVSIHGGNVYIVSTGYDSILVFDLDTQQFSLGFHLCLDEKRLRVAAFDPRGAFGPEPKNVFHLNSVCCDQSGLYFSGLRTPGMLQVQGRHLSCAAELPPGTHNAQHFRGGVIFNDTASDRVCGRFEGRQFEISLHAAAESVAKWKHAPDALARPLFARGLCALSKQYVATGQSPSTISVYDVEHATLMTQVELSHDVRNAVHGLAVWPFAP